MNAQGKMVGTALQNLELITRQRKNIAIIRLANQDEYLLKQRNKIETPVWFA